MPTTDQPTQNAPSLIDLPFDLICYLGINFLDYNNAFLFINYVIKENKVLFPDSDVKTHIAHFYKQYNLRELFANKPRTRISASGNSSVYLSSKNECYVWGQYLHSNKNFIPQKLPLPLVEKTNFWKKESVRVAKIAGENSRILLLTSTGKVYFYGAGFGENSSTEDFTPKPIHALADKTFIDIALCRTHALLLTSKGKVYIWETPSFSGRKNSSPELIQSIQDKVITQIYVRPFHSLCLTNKGEVYSFGFNPNEESVSGYEHTTPHLITALSHTKIISGALGAWHALFLAVDGKVYGYGGNKACETGFKETTLIDSLQGLFIAKVAAGNGYSLFLTDKGTVYGLGYNHLGELGIMKKKNAYIRTATLLSSLKDEFIIDIAAGNNHTLCLSQRGVIYSFGANTKGQLGHENANKFPQTVKFSESTVMEEVQALQITNFK